jgi:hypothetical protein
VISEDIEVEKSRKIVVDGRERIVVVPNEGGSIVVDPDSLELETGAQVQETESNSLKEERKNGKTR